MTRGATPEAEWDVIGTVRAGAEQAPLLEKRRRPGIEYLDRFGKIVPW